MPGRTGVSLWEVFAGSRATETAGRSLKQKCFYYCTYDPIFGSKAQSFGQS